MVKLDTVDKYIDAQPPEVSARLTQIRELFNRLLPDAKESISYGIPTFTFGKERLYISAFKNHIGMYPMLGLSELEKDLLPYLGQGTKASLHFKHSEPLPIDLIEKIIVARFLR